MILDDIIEKRKIQLEKEKTAVSPEKMKKNALETTTPCRDFYAALKKSSLSVISEVKKASPSKSVICEDFHPVETAEAYEKAGADAISCLTEEFYFKGSSDYLKAIRKAVDIPILRKDFIFDEYQIYEARSIGADAVLLIAAVLDTETMNNFRELAESLGMNCLFEAHNEEELENILKCSPKIIGVNNRNLKTFEVSLENTKRLAAMIPDSCVKISESGIKDNADMKFVRECGADAVLIGETLMRSGNIGETMKALRYGT
ncbi:MAG: indole-3-glycerol phosphate synthase TrpC [Clostridium sp.]|nr:indole-3-glycerol phosphate synthase TrpC [Clostridium sp.]MCM1546779.1 indole-3-glycerol phosphate synthase TrpC [Ruminococcus sp.]